MGWPFPILAMRVQHALSEESGDVVRAGPPYFLPDNGIGGSAGKMVSIDKGLGDSLPPA